MESLNGRTPKPTDSMKEVTRRSFVAFFRPSFTASPRGFAPRSDSNSLTRRKAASKSSASANACRAARIHSSFFAPVASAIRPRTSSTG